MSGESECPPLWLNLRVLSPHPVGFLPLLIAFIHIPREREQGLTLL